MKPYYYQVGVRAVQPVKQVKYGLTVFECLYFDYLVDAVKIDETGNQNR